MKQLRPAFRLTMLCVALGVYSTAMATDISNVPLWSSLTAAVKPNVLFVLDDSGSMGNDYIPDDAGNWRKTTAQSCSRYTGCSLYEYGQFGRRSSQCNGMAFNPALSYSLRVNADGSTYADATDADLSSMFAPTGGSANTVLWVPIDAISSAAAVTTGTLTVQLSYAPSGATYYPDMVVTVYDGSLSSRYSSGTVRTWDPSTLTMTINVVYGRTDGATMSSPRLAMGSPNDAYVFTYSGSQTPLNFEYSTTSVKTGTTFYQECDSHYDSSTGRGVFKPLLLSLNYQVCDPASGVCDAAKGKEVLKAYWRWYRYYRTRMLMMQSAASLAFKGFDDKYRVGFTTISSTDVTSGMLDVSDFNMDQKTSFYSSLYGASPGGSTPLRGAVMKAGRYFAKQMPGQTYDPMQYSCQKNFIILSTDGYWNTGDETSAYTSLNIDGSARVGNQDSGLKRPYNDGGTVTTTATTTWSSTRYFTRTTVTQLDATLQRTEKTVYERNVTYTSSTSKACKGGTTPYTRNSETRSDSVTYTKKDTQRTDVSDMSQTTSYSQVTKTINGDTTVGSDVPTVGAVNTISTSPAVFVESDTTSGSPVSTSWAAVKPYVVCASSKPADIPGTTSVYDAGSWAVTAGSTTTPKSGTTPVVTDVTTSTTTTDRSTATNTVTAGGTPDSLSDLAWYYYNTDLRTDALGNCTGSMGLDVCENNVKAPGGEDWQTAQHMTFYGLSLGAGNSLKYQKDYMTATTGDFAAIKAGTKEWPAPAADTVTAVDDLWHAAVNGRGLYFSALDPNALSYSLASALSDITKISGTAAAAATSTLQPVRGDNGVYVSQFTSPDWIGDLKKYEFDDDGNVTTVVYDDAGKVMTDAYKWSAAQRLTPTYVRNIYYFSPGTGGAGGTLRAFTTDAATGLSADELASFGNVCSKAAADRLFQCEGADATKLAALNSSTNMVNYLRGQAITGYRTRSQILGDLVNSAPVYVGKPTFKYLEDGYATWATSTATLSKRSKILLVGGNDGMLHAFNEGDGTEAWAYIPRLVMSNLYKLADDNYRFKHQYYVDGTVVVSDIYDAGGHTWKTILVGGLNSGGRGFYALDITDTLHPQALWELGPDQLPAGEGDRMGLSFGNPIVTKRADGTWVVALTSGYNNPAGGGYLFIVNALTGELIKTEPTLNAAGANVGDGLAKINAWIESQEENKALRFYGGDMQGQLWRFDTDNLVEPKGKALMLAQFKSGDSAHLPQPITTMPMLAEFDANGATRRVVYVGTGRYLGRTDVSSNDQQSIYGVVDDLTNTSLGDVRATDGALVRQAIDATVTPRKVGSAATAVDWSTNKGWYVDLYDRAERVNVDMLLVANTLVAVGNVPGPASSICDRPGANSAYLYSFNIITGGGESSGLGSLVAGLGAIQTAKKEDGTGGKLKLVITKTTGELPTKELTPLTVSGQPAHRTAWRELF